MESKQGGVGAPPLPIGLPSTAPRVLCSESNRSTGFRHSIHSGGDRTESPRTKITTSVSNNHDVGQAQLHAVRLRHPVKAINERRSCRHRQTRPKVERREDRRRANWHLSEDAYLRYKSPLDHPNYQWLASGRHQT
ncbi:hypothetical protein NPIL_221321 [Nephila pilipes]|uniref:Uncharacterized protein n=1 Tax=Nephila pilipes TaxID=299642 RepID=A0A8X6QVD5_NEPPI|nr:hypothetical protein NPIL_221321 [Nephila pilipes]